MSDNVFRVILFSSVFVVVLVAWLFSLMYERVLFDRPSEFNRQVRVTENLWGRRFLRFGDDKATQSAALARSPLLGVLPYVRESVELASRAGRVGRVLVVGMGGGSMGMLMRSRYPLAFIDLVEVDPVVVEAAELLGFQADARMVVTVGDGAAFIQAVRSRYDVVFLDAYDGLDVPEHLLSAEFFASVFAALAPGGVVLSNVLSREMNPEFDLVLRGLRVGLDVGAVAVPGGRYNCVVVGVRGVEALRGVALQRAGSCGVG